jgi:uncharacterized repeat protein (TIGR03803 family)
VIPDPDGGKAGFMSTTVQHRGWSFRIRLRAAGATLAVVMVLVPAVLATRAQAQTYTILHSFNFSEDGQTPYGGLVRDTRGNLYGTAFYGGPSGCCEGAVFVVSATGGEGILHFFSGPLTDGANPYGGLLRDVSGNLYGTTFEGGAAEVGAVFKLDTAGRETVLYSFTGEPDGAYPQAGVVEDGAGNLYGTTSVGGSSVCSAGCGVVFKIDTTGKETVLHAFAAFPTDGEFPVANLVRDRAGNLYGTTPYGGAYDDGVVFKVDATGKEAVLYNFTGGVDGGNPYGGLVRDAAGDLYGTTYTGGSGACGGDGCGAVFKLAPTGKETVLHSFHGPDGANPTAGLVRDLAGNLYGATLSGGAFHQGVVFKLDTTGKETVLHSFSGNGGIYPVSLYSSLVRDAAGNLYGTTPGGGPGGGYGVVFKISP